MSFEGLYCYCRRPDPRDGSTMIYCEKCADWFHDKCLFDNPLDVKEALKNDTFICPKCRGDIDEYNKCLERIKKQSEKVDQTNGRTVRKRLLKAEYSQDSSSESDDDDDDNISLGNLQQKTALKKERKYKTCFITTYFTKIKS